MSQFLYHSGSGFLSSISDSFVGGFSIGPKLSLGSTQQFGIESNLEFLDIQDEGDEYTLVYDFVSVLQAAQLCGLDLLPISWQQALGSLGDGGTANLNQSYLNLQLSFAFKRMNNLTFLAAGPAGETKIFQAIVSEILALSHPVMRAHPNIVKVLGISWEIDPSSHRVWPVLVFTKTQFGDLHDFMNTNNGRNLTFFERLDFCVAIGSALHTTHACRVVHGDIKPSNILVFRKDDGKYYPKLSDFGYSTLVPYTNNFVKLAISRPWNAPEYHSREFSFSDGKKTDIYSFGLLCLWILLKEDLEKSGISFDEVKSFEELKKQGKLLEKVQEALLERALSKDMQLELMLFFTHTLENDPVKRAGSVAEVVYILRGLSIASSYPTLITPEEQKLETRLSKVARTGFEISRYILQLVQADFRVREYIFKSLEKRAQESHEEFIAFQVAFCYYTGFGVAANQMKVSEWLEKAGKLHKALELLIQEVSRQVHISENYQDLKFYLDTSLEENLDNGYLYRMQYATAYHGIPDIDVKYEREIRDMGASLGSDYTNLITLNLRHILALVLYGRGEFRRAQEILEHLVNELGAHPFSYHEKALLALTLYHQGEFGKAEKLQQELVEDAYFEPSHPDTITRVNNLAVTLCSQHRWDECVGLYLRTLELVRKKSSLGEEHPNVLTIKHNLAAAYLWQGKWVDSRRIQLETLEARKRVLGEDHRETMHSYTNLGVLYWEQGLREQALDYLEAVVAKSRRLWGARDRDTARYSLALAKYYLNLSRYYDVEELLRDYVEAFDRGETDLLILEKTLIVAEAMVRLEKHKSAERLISTIASKLPKVDYLTEITDQTLLTTALLLSRVYELQRRWAEVTKLQPRIIAYYKNLYGEQCTEIFETTIALGRALYHEGRFQEAEKLVSERITTLQCFRKTTDSTNVSYDLYFTKSDAQFELLQDIQIASGNFRKAREANEKLIDVRSVKFGVHHPLVFNAKAKAAWLLEQEELTEEANTLYSSTLEEARQQLGDDHYQALLLMVDLARTYRKQRDWTTSEKLCQEVVDRRANLRSPGLNYGSKSQLDAVYIIALSDLATSIYLQGRGEDAEQLQVTTLRLSNEIHGPEHFQTLIAMFNLAMTYKHKKSFAEYEKLLLKFLNIQKPRYFPKLRITPHVIGDLMAHYEECCRWNSVVDFYDDWVKHIRPELERKPLWIVSLHMCVLRSLAEQGKWGELEKRMREFILEHENSRRQTPIGTIQYHKMQLRSFFRQGKLSDAKEICWKCIELYQVGLVDRDPLPPDFLEAAHDLPAELATAGRIGEALSLQRQLLKISEKLHPKASITLTKREMLASLLQCSLYPAEGSIFSDNEDASLAELEAVFRAAIEERREMGLLDDPNTWETMKELGEFYIFVGRYPDALAMFVKRAKAVRMASNEANERHANDQGLERAIQIVSQVAYRLTQAGEQSQEEEGAALFQLLAEVSLQELGEGHQITRSCVLNAAMVNTTHPTANSSSA